MEAKRNPVFLVPTDFSAVCTNAARRAAAVAKSIHYKLTLLHVIDRATKSELKKEKKGEEVIIERLNDLAGSLKKEYRVEIAVIAREGDIFTTIAEVAEDLNASLIFLGTHGKVGMQKVTGSFALRVVLSSEIPTIVIQKRPFEKGFSKIVLPITNETGPWSKTKWAASIAKEFNAEILIFQLPGDQLDDVITMITNHFEVNKVKYSLKIDNKSGNFTKHVIDYATAENAELIMIMTNPDSGFTKFFLGSYDEDIIFNTSQIPVMCINPRDFKWKKVVTR